MEGCDDNELLYLMRCGNQEAENCLYRRYYKSIRHWIAPYIKRALLGYEYEDYLQSVMLFFPLALDSYRDDLNASLKTFLHKVMIRRLISALQTNRDLRMYGQMIFSLDEWTDDRENTRLEEIIGDPYERHSPEKLLMVKEKHHYYAAQMDEKATVLEKEVVSFRQAGYEMEEIAKILHISIKSVYNSMYRYHKKLLGIDDLK